MAKYRTYPVWDLVCSDCKRMVGMRTELGEYPSAWQYVICHHCGGNAHPTKNPRLVRYPEPYDVGIAAQQEEKE